MKKLVQDNVNVSLSVVGGTSWEDSESYLDELKATVSDYKLNVNFLGWSDDVVSVLQGSNIFTLTSENEGLPGVIIEAMATGLPVVTTDAGGCKDAVINSVNGYVVPIGDIDAIAKAITSLIGEDSRHKFGSRSREIAVHEYSIASFEGRFYSLIDKMKT